jgi:hypothetical protein
MGVQKGSGKFRITELSDPMVTFTRLPYEIPAIWHTEIYKWPREITTRRASGTYTYGPTTLHAKISIPFEINKTISVRGYFIMPVEYAISTDNLIYTTNIYSGQDPLKGCIFY